MVAQRESHDLTEAEEILAEEEAAAGVDVAVEDDPKKKQKLPDIPVAEVATVTCRADLDRILAAHREWIAAVFDPRAEVAAGRANLKGADLRGYDLQGVNLSGANLSGVNLQGVNLSRANLTVADLRGAFLQHADLSGAKLMRAKVDGANFVGADLTNALLVGLDLSLAITEEKLAAPELAPSKPANEATHELVDDTVHTDDSTGFATASLTSAPTSAEV